VCHANPTKPQESVLEKRFPWLGLTLILTVSLVVFGVLGLHGALYPRLPGEVSPSS